MSESKSKVHVRNNSGNNEWYTPEWLVEGIRRVLGTIDLDPASCEFANRTVKALKYFDKESDGLSQNWVGNVFMNPPYSRDLLPKFVDKYVEEVMSYNIRNGCVLVNNATETAWFKKLVKLSDYMLLLNSRVKFVSENGVKKTPLQGQVLFFVFEGISPKLRMFDEFHSDSSIFTRLEVL